MKNNHFRHHVNCKFGSVNLHRKETHATEMLQDRDTAFRFNVMLLT